MIGGTGRDLLNEVSRHQGTLVYMYLNLHKVIQV